MTAPIRLRLSRGKGFNLQSYSWFVNDLPAVNVARPSRWGNPFRVGDPDVPDAETAVRLYREWLLPYDHETGRLTDFVRGEANIEAIRRELRGKNLACWCPLDSPCHADVLLDIANAPEEDK